jgi:RNA recognition motif-containing protein
MTEQVISQTKLFVSGLAWKMRGLQMREEFEKFGEVVFARVVLDKDTGRSRGFGFVEFVNPEDATKAKEEMDNTELWEREIKVDFAKENPEKLQARQEEITNAEESSEDEGDGEV